MYNELEFTKYDQQWNFTEDYYVIKRQLPDSRGEYFVNLMLNTCKLYCPDAANEAEAKECSVGFTFLHDFRIMVSKLEEMRYQSIMHG